MAVERLRRIHHRDPEATTQLNDLRRRLSLEAELVSPRSRQLTEKVFGAALSPVQVVERICQEVRQHGWDALIYFTEQFDQVTLTSATARVGEDELNSAHKAADPDFLETIRRVRRNVWSFQAGLVHSEAQLSLPGKGQLKLRYRPMRRVGVCVPGGAAAYPSTLLMTVVPAQAAGVKEIAVVMPPTATGAYNREMLAVCRELNVREVYRLGGAQAVAALAYGVAGLPQVDMIVGPGNQFVTLAKKYVFGQIAIDCLAGPSEVIVLADDSANPSHVAADLIAQAEHGPGSSILMTWHEPLLDQVEKELAQQLATLDRATQARASLLEFGALALARDVGQALTWTNALAPEHLHIIARGAAELAEKIDNAGAIFVGPHSPVALGDYAAGPSHVLPTGGTARFASGLSANDFLRRTSVLSFTARGMADLAEDVGRLAAREGLTGHAASVTRRL